MKQNNWANKQVLQKHAHKMQAIKDMVDVQPQLNIISQNTMTEGGQTFGG